MEVSHTTRLLRPVVRFRNCKKSKKKKQTVSDGHVEIPGARVRLREQPMGHAGMEGGRCRCRHGQCPARHS